MTGEGLWWDFRSLKFGFQDLRRDVCRQLLTHKKGHIGRDSHTRNEANGLAEHLDSRRHTISKHDKILAE
jgi:hypothetical protein